MRETQGDSNGDGFGVVEADAASVAVWARALAAGQEVWLSCAAVRVVHS